MAGLEATLAPTVPRFTPNPHQDVEDLVRLLLRQSGEFERRKKLISAAVTWINAFSQFKHLRRQIGLPDNDLQALGYGMLLANLKSRGKGLLQLIGRGILDPSELPLSVEDLEACVRELQQDDILLDSGLLRNEEKLEDVAAIFGGT
jgi:hypothetical protein